MNGIQKLTCVVATGLLMAAGVGTVHAKEDRSGAMIKLKKTFPNMQADALEPTPVVDFYEVTAGDQVFYFHEPSGYIFFGEMWSAEGVSITGKKKAKLSADRLSKIPLSKAIKIGSGPKKIIEFTDPDDRFCREVDAFLKTRTNEVTRYVFLIPNDKINPAARAKAAFILAANDQANAFRKVYDGDYDGSKISVSTEAALKQLSELSDLPKAIGVTGLPSLWVEGVFVKGNNIPLIASILDGRKEAPKK